jgi:hypothetical protein
MPLMLHPAGGKLLIVSGPKLAAGVGCCCDDAPNCASFASCVNESGGSASIDLDIRPDGVADDGCSDCDPDLNTTIIRSGPFTYTDDAASCRIAVSPAASGITICPPVNIPVSTSAFVRLNKTGGAPVSFEAQAQLRYGGGTPTQHVFFTGPHALPSAELDAFCAGEEIPLAYSIAGSTGTLCDSTAATVYLRKS